MPARSKVMNLPTEVRTALNERLLHQGFQDYEGLAAWLEEQGYEISSSSVHRYGQQFERRIAALELATEQTKVIVERLGDDGGSMGEAVTALVQQGAYEVLLDMLESKEFGDMTLPQLGQMVARLNKTGIEQKKWAQQVRALAQATAQEVSDIAKEQGLSDDVASAIRQKILGITK